MSTPGLTLMGAVCTTGKLPRSIMRARDGSFALMEGDRVLCVVSQRKAEDLAIAIAAGDAAALTEPTAMLSVAVYLVALVVRHEATAPADGPAAIPLPDVST